MFSPGAASAELVSDAIDAAKPEGPAVVVAIDGPSGAGKSALTGELALLRGDVAIVEGDDFYRPLNESTRAALTPIEAVDLLFDWERLRDQVLAPLIRGEDAQYRRYDWTAGRLGDDVATVAAQPIRKLRSRDIDTAAMSSGAAISAQYGRSSPPVLATSPAIQTTFATTRPAR